MYIAILYTLDPECKVLSKGIECYLMLIRISLYSGM